MLNKVEKIVRQAGEIAKRDFLSSIITHYKKELGNFSTQTDVEIEDFLVDRLKKLLPKSGFFLEERDNHKSQSEYEWIIDPIDGTHNFHLGFPNFSISVALKNKSQIVMGLIYNPIANQMYKAELGRGATINDQRISVSSNSQLEKTSLVYSQGYEVSRTEGLIKLVFDKISPKIERLMINWSVALDYCLLARGVADVAITYKGEVYDVAAGFLIAKEAGARITDFSGNPANYNTPDLLLTNGTKIHEYFVKEISKL